MFDIDDAHDRGLCGKLGYRLGALVASGIDLGQANCGVRSSSGSLVMLSASRRTFISHSSWPLARRLTVWSRLARCRRQDDACRWIYQMGLFARIADDGLISMGVHGHIICGKALNAKAHVRAAVEKKQHAS
jgi:hypothetical protein